MSTRSLPPTVSKAEESQRVFLCPDRTPVSAEPIPNGSGSLFPRARRKVHPAHWVALVRCRTWAEIGGSVWWLIRVRASLPVAPGTPAIDALLPYASSTRTTAVPQKGALLTGSEMPEFGPGCVTTPQRHVRKNQFESIPRKASYSHQTSKRTATDPIQPPPARKRFQTPYFEFSHSLDHIQT